MFIKYGTSPSSSSEALNPESFIASDHHFSFSTHCFSCSSGVIFYSFNFYSFAAISAWISLPSSSLSVSSATFHEVFFGPAFSSSSSSFFNSSISFARAALRFSSSETLAFDVV